MDYTQTLNLPKTDFPMRAALPQREPEILSKWLSDDLYGKLMKHNEGKPSFILHDGPPYANGDMHMGHALNKTLKDIITRFKNMDGFCAPYNHGWDTHGLPIERQAIAKLGINRAAVSISNFRALCKEFALGYVANQKTQIQRLGCIGNWDDSYVTLAPEFEAKQIEVFAAMANKGYIYRGLKPIYWCPDCETALAEAEIEYSQDKTKSIYVKFRVNDDKGVFDSAPIDKKNIYFVIWTTTTWTLPGNVAIALNAEFEYSLVKVGEEAYIIASELVENTMRAAKIESWEVIGKYKGGEMEYITCRHPFIERDSVVIVGDHVTLESGTGCVHTAPGHGVEDYIACQKYKDIPIIVPVDDKGYLNDLAGEFSGMFYEDSNAAIGKKLASVGALYAIESIEHKYPHCWRCHKPIVFRATEQWFASVDAIKKDALEAIKGVQWIPAWGEDRISSMVADRNDWCISRQRTWGVPIPIFYCADCKEPLISDAAMKAVSEFFAKNGSGAWYEHDAEEILPPHTACKCGCTHFTKEKDIMDVWFDSGSSHSGVLEVKKGLSFPADLYLEGNDQYRGWFQSSLLTSIAAKGKAPYKAVITHGMIVDEEGKKFSKSAGNGISPKDIIDKYGADILRLWVVSADYKTDMHISNEILKQLSEAYRKIRNTARYILGNISDFNPECDSVSHEDMLPLDKWALTRFRSVVGRTLDAYRAYEFHQIFHTLHSFCVVDMSNFYLDVIKDRLYTEKTDSLARRSAQSAMYEILESMTLLLVPVLAYTSEEIWAAMPHGKGRNKEYALLNDMPRYEDMYSDEAVSEKFDRLLEIREAVSKALEEARAAKVIGSSLGASVAIRESGEEYELLKSFGKELETLFIVSNVTLGEGEREITVSAAEGEKCERCWVINDTVGKNSEHPTLCARCASCVEEI